MLNPPMRAVWVHRSQHFGWLSNVTVFKTSYSFYSFAHSFFHIYFSLYAALPFVSKREKPLGFEPLAGYLRFIILYKNKSFALIALNLVSQLLNGVIIIISGTSPKR
jgi:hypothetical protein